MKQRLITVANAAGRFRGAADPVAAHSVDLPCAAVHAAFAVGGGAGRVACAFLRC